MTRDEIIALAREAGDDVEHTLPSDLDFLERFAALVAAAEREKCAQLVEKNADVCGPNTMRIDADAVAYHNGAWTSKPPSSRSPSLE